MSCWAGKAVSGPFQFKFLRENRRRGDMETKEGKAGSGARSFAGVVLLNALLAFPVLYLVYKHFNPAVTPWDISFYMEIADAGPAAFEPPFRFRVDRKRTRLN